MPEKLQLGLEFGATSCVGVCSVSASDRAHPNKLPFTGTLLLLDESSDKPPHGANGHRIYVPKAVAKRRLDTLIGMGVNYTRELNGHSTRHKVGVITGAWIDGNRVKVSGSLWRKDFPEVLEDLRGQSDVGMSMELADVFVRDRDEPVWHLEDFHFSGATALYKSDAAYSKTALAAAAAAQGGEGGSKAMPKPEKNGKPAAAVDPGASRGALLESIAASVGSAVQTGIQQGMASLKESLDTGFTSLKERDAKLLAGLEDLRTVASVSASAIDVDDEEEADVHAAKDEEDEEFPPEEEDGELEEDEDDDAEEEIDAELENLEEDPAEEEPGQENKNAKNRGNKTAVSSKTGKAKSMPVLAAHEVQGSASRVLLSRLHASNQKLAARDKVNRKKISKLENRIEAMAAQLEAAAEATDRRTVVSAELSTVLAKSNVDVRELLASGRKLSIGEVDQMLSPEALGHSLDPTTRIALKHQLMQRNMMEQGEVVRNYAA